MRLVDDDLFQLLKGCGRSMVKNTRFTFEQLFNGPSSLEERRFTARNSQMFDQRQKAGNYQPSPSLVQTD